MSSKWFAHFKCEKSRTLGEREVKPRLLLCFEDSVSSPNYFEQLRKHMGILKETFIVDFDPSCSDPLSVVKRAADLRDRYLKSDDLDESDQIWCIVDVNGHMTMCDAQQYAAEQNINLAISNPCFEYWILLHFEDTAPGFNNCADVIAHLKSKNYVTEYKKGSYDFGTIVDRAGVAATRAKRQFEGKAEPDPTKCCPCTMVYKLVQSIGAGFDLGSAR